MEPHRDTAIISHDTSLPHLIAFWVWDKGRRTGSAGTRRMYEQTLSHFRTWLLDHHLDLDADPRAVALAAQAWADTPLTPRHHEDAPAKVSNNTYNRKLAIVSSFYSWVIRRRLWPTITSNPMKDVDRRPPNGEHAAVFTADDIAERLRAINQTTPIGRRDYAILAVLIYTGRRVAEIASLRLGQLTRQGDRVLLRFHTKGDKIIDDLLPKPVAAAFLRYVHATYGNTFTTSSPDLPVWVSYSHRGSEPGAAITSETVRRIVQRYLGVTTVHSTRHTFAQIMDDHGASLSEIQGRLGHSSIAITAKYMHSLPKPVNKHGDAIAEAFGIE